MSSPLNYELTLAELLIPNYHGPIKCALVLANFSTTISYPCRPLHLVNLKIDLSDKLYLSVFTQSSEVGCLEIPHSAFASGFLDQTFKLYENSISVDREKCQLKVTGEVHLVIKKLEDICLRCEGLEKLVRDIKLDMVDIDDTVHNHPAAVLAEGKSDKAAAGIKKSAKKQALRSGKGEKSAKGENPAKAEAVDKEKQELSDDQAGSARSGTSPAKNEGQKKGGVGRQSDLLKPDASKKDLARATPSKSDAFGSGAKDTEKQELSDDQAGSARSGASPGKNEGQKKGGPGRQSDLLKPDASKKDLGRVTPSKSDAFGSGAKDQRGFEELKDPRSSGETREPRGLGESKEPRSSRDPRGLGESKDPRNSGEFKDPRNSFEPRESKDPRSAEYRDPKAETVGAKGEPKDKSEKSNTFAAKPAFAPQPALSEQDLKRMLEESYKSRRDPTDQLSARLKEQREALEAAISDKSLAVEKLGEISDKLRGSERENDLLRQSLGEKESLLSTLTSKASIADSFQKEIQSLNQQLEKAIADNNGLEKKLKEIMSNFSNSNTNLNKRIEDLTKEKSELLGKIEELIKQNHSLKQENDRYANLVNELWAQIALLQAELEAQKAKENREKHLASLLAEEEKQKNLLKKQLEDAGKKLADQANKFSKENAKLLQDKAATEKKNADLMKSLDRSEKDMNALRRELEKSHSDLVALEKHVHFNEDLNGIINQLSKNNSDSEGQFAALSDQLNFMKDRIDTQEDYIKEQSEKINELETSHLEKDEQIANLEAIIDELRKDREIYKPINKDPIDIALSDYVNTRPSGLKVNFEREDHGIYNFGTKKIFVKLEQGKLLIRVGGGYMQVEDFVKLYSPVELERFSNLKKEQAQKMRKEYLGKYADSLVPKNKNEMSPERAIKIMKDQIASGSYTPYYAVQLKSPERTANRSVSERMSKN